MRIPQKPPDFGSLMAELARSQKLVSIFQAIAGPEVEKRYLHWDELRFRKPPEGLTHKEWWLGLKMVSRLMAT
jgi:hypothetical protein